VGLSRSVQPEPHLTSTGFGFHPASPAEDGVRRPRDRGGDPPSRHL